MNRQNDKTIYIVLIALAFLAYRHWDKVGTVISAPGPRTVLIVRESAATTPVLARTLTALRDGASAAYLKEKGHSLLILDKDSIGPDGSPATVVEKWKPFNQLPELLIISPPDKLLHRGKLPESADGVLQILNANGG